MLLILQLEKKNGFVGEINKCCTQHACGNVYLRKVGMDVASARRHHSAKHK